MMLGLAAGGAFVAATPAAAASQTRYVATTGSDTDNDCTDAAHPCLTIAHAIDEADAGDTVSVGPGDFHEALDIRISLTLVGAGDTGSGRTTIDGDNSGDPSIEVDGLDNQTPPQVTIKDLDVSGNSDNDGIFGVGDPGAGAQTGVTVLDCVVDNNDDNGIELTGDVTGSIDGTTVSGNGDEGVTTGEVLADPPVITLTGDVVDRNGNGGVVNEGGTITINSSTLDHNTGAGVVADIESGSVTVNTSTVSNTVAFTDHLGGVEYGGGVLVFPGASSSIHSSTIFGNTEWGVLDFGGIASVTNSTVAGTLATTSNEGGFPSGGLSVVVEVPGIAKKAQAAFASHSRADKQNHVATKPTKTGAIAAPSLTATATITTDSGLVADCAGPVTDGGYNLAGDDSCDFSATGSINNGHAKLGPLANNGGPTKTLLPAKGSDAIDAIPAAATSCQTPNADQRGISRPQGPRCDIGAVEAAQPPIVISPKSLPNGRVGKHYSVTLTATGGLGAPYEWSLAPSSDPLPPGLTLSTGGVISGTPTAAGTYPIIVSVDDPTQKHYTIVITAARTPSSGPSGSSSPPQGSTLPNTGANVSQLLTLGGWAIGLGIVLMGATAALGRRRNYRRLH